MNTGIFNNDFFPTPPEVTELMLRDVDCNGKTILEPSAGKGDIVDILKLHGAKNIIACEKSPELSAILASKCNIIGDDFLKVESHQVSHIDLIVMNPPFSADEKHILHAWEIAPDGCRIIALCNANTIDEQKRYYRDRKVLGELIDQYGNSENIGEVFKNAERKTDVEVCLVSLLKPGASYDAEFNGFFMEEEPEHPQGIGIMPYDIIRDLVNRYINTIKIFDEQLDAAVRINNLTSQFYSSKIAMTCTNEGKPQKRNEFKKDLQKSAWRYIFSKMNMHKYATKGLIEDINNFVEQQSQIPFTMKNIYQMLSCVEQTHSQRMDKALLEVFEKVTKHYHENRYNVEGWKTNSHYFLGQKFILPRVVDSSWGEKVHTNHYGWADIVDDMKKALCFLTGREYGGYEECFSSFLNENSCKFGQLYEWGFFQFRAYKKGTVHFTFADENVWALFNQRIAKILGYPLPECFNKNKNQEPAPDPIPAPEANNHPEPEALILIEENSGENLISELNETYSFLTAMENHSQSFDICRKNIRTELALRFPGVKFSVKKTHYSTVNISWADDPTTEQVDKILGKYEDHVSDETGDFRDYSPSAFNKLFGGAKYVFTSREMTEKTRQVFHAWAAQRFEAKDTYDCYSFEVLAHRFFYKSEIPDCDIKIVAKSIDMGFYSPERFWRVLPASMVLDDEKNDIGEEAVVVDQNQLSLF